MLDWRSSLHMQGIDLEQRHLPRRMASPRGLPSCQNCSNQTALISLLLWTYMSCHTGPRVLLTMTKYNFDILHLSCLY